MEVIQSCEAAASVYIPLDRILQAMPHMLCSRTALRMSCSTVSMLSCEYRKIVRHQSRIEMSNGRYRKQELESI